MEDRFEARLGEMIGQAQVSPESLAGMPERLEAFVAPYAALLEGQAPTAHVGGYISGLLSKLHRKTSEGIAYLLDQGRQGLQKFIGHLKWDHRPLVLELGRQVGEAIGEADAVIVFDPSGFKKKGSASVGVARQWCGREGKVDNCQVGIYMAYVSRREHALVNVRLYLPEEWTKDRKRCRTAGVTKGTKFKTRHELALEMLEEQGPNLPHGWIAGDDEMGRSSWFRGELQARGETYLLDVPSNTLVRDLEASPPEYSGHGRPPKVAFIRVDAWAKALPESAWTKITCGTRRRGRWRWRPCSAAWRPRAERRMRNCCSSRARGSRTGRASTTTICRMRSPARRCLNWCGWPPPNTALRNAWNGRRKRRAWPTTRCEPCRGGITTRFCRSSPRGSSSRRRAGKKIRTPALTVPRMADMIGSQIEHHFRAHSPEVSSRRSTRWTERSELARFYYYRRRKLMPPLKNQLRL